MANYDKIVFSKFQESCYLLNRKDNGEKSNTPYVPFMISYKKINLIIFQ